MASREYGRISVQKVARAITKHGGEAKIRKAYAELRKVANKRIQRAQKTGALMDETLFQKTSEIEKGDVERLAKAYSNVLKFLNSKRSTAEGRRASAKKTAKTLTDLGYEGITEKNVDLFNTFMENFRRKYEIDTPEGKKLLMDSDFALEAFDAISERFTSKTNARSISRYFNDYLREQGLESEIRWL